VPGNLRPILRSARAGELARNDLILAKKEVLTQEAQRALSASRYAALLTQYRSITGLSDLPSVIREAAPASTEIPADHPALAAGSRSATRARAERDRIVADRRANPVLSLGGKTERADSTTDYNPSLILEINVPLGTRRQAAPAIAAGERSVTEVLTALARIRRDLDTALIRARAENELTVAAARLANQQWTLAAEGLHLTTRAFELGETDLVALLRARQQALIAERNYELSQLEQGRAIARLNQLIGVIPE